MDIHTEKILSIVESSEDKKRGVCIFSSEKMITDSFGLENLSAEKLLRFIDHIMGVNETLGNDEAREYEEHFYMCDSCLRELERIFYIKYRKGDFEPDVLEKMNVM